MKFLVPMTAIVVAFAACTREDDIIVPVDNKETLHITITPEVDDLFDETGTKTYIDKDGDIDNTIFWGDNEHMKIAVLADGDADKATFAVADAAASASGSTTTTFNVDVTPSVTGSSYTYVGLYPAEASVNNNSVTEHSVVLKAKQNATGNSYDPASYILVARHEAGKTTSNVNWDAQYRRATALNKMTLKGIDDDLISVTITAPANTPLAGYRSFNLLTDEFGSVTEAVNHIEVSYETAITGSDVSGVNHKEIWFNSWDVELASGAQLTIVAKSALKTYTKTITANVNGIKFKEGYLNTIGINMANASVVETPAPVVVWNDVFSECTSGTTALTSLYGSVSEFTSAYSGLTYVYPMAGAIRVGKASDSGSITTPVLSSISGSNANLLIVFKAAGWKGKDAKLTLVANKGTVTEGQTAIASEDGMNSASGHSPEMTGTEYTFHVTGADNTTKITFNTTNSIGIDDLVITQVFGEEPTPITWKLSSIEITTPPTKTVYSVGESFAPAGMVVVAHYSDASDPTNVKEETVDNTNLSFDPSGALAVSNTSVTVSYTVGEITRTTSQSITVNPVNYATLGTSNVDFDNDGYTVNGYNAIKAGTTSSAGSVSLTVPSGTTILHIHAAGWNNESVTLTIEGATVSPSSINLIANSGISGSAKAYTLAGGVSISDFYFNLALSNITSDTELTFTATSGKRFVIWGINAEVGTPTVATPTFSFNSSGNTVSISCATEGASIYYTTDGTDPDTSSSVYSEAISISGNQKTIKAFATKSNYDDSEVATVTYYAINRAATTNGSIAAIDYATEGEEITVTVTADSGYTLGTLSVTDSSDNAVYVSNDKFTMPSSAVTITATFVEVTGPKTTTLTNANIVASTGSTSYGSITNLKDGNNNSYTAYAIKNHHSNATSGYKFLQIKKYASGTAYYIGLPELGTKITSITMTVSNSSKPMTDGGNTATLFFSASNSTSATGTGVASGTGSSSVTIDCSSLNLNSGYITADGAVRIWDVAITYE
jgi:hypothetical protein